MAKQPRILAGETAAITGAARGIGRATAAAFLRQGMRVAIGDVDLDGGQPYRRRARRERRRAGARRDRPRLVQRVPGRRRGAARAAGRARQQRRDHAGRALHRRGRPDRAADGRHQPPRRDPRHQARARADGPARPRPHRQHLLAGGQVRRARRRDVLGDQARGRRPDRGGPRRAAADGRPHRRQLRDAGRRQHRARLRPGRGARGEQPRADGSRRRDRRGAAARDGRRVGAEVGQAHEPVGLAAAAHVGEGIGRAIKADRVLAGADANVRREYELRAARSEPGLEPAPERQRITESAARITESAGD